MSAPTRADYCAVAVAECFRGDGEIVANAIGNMQAIGGRLARASFEPDLVMTDGVAFLAANDIPMGASDTPTVVEGWMPYRNLFDVVWSGRRHVMMGATQVDRFGNQNIACIGDYAKPNVQLLGVRGAPGNTINHATSYWIPSHTDRVFVPEVDVVSGIGYDRAAALGEAESRFHEIRRVVTNLGTFDFDTPDHSMRIRTLHPGVTVDDVISNTGFELLVPDDIPFTRDPTEDELRILNEVIDPKNFRGNEVKG